MKSLLPLFSLPAVLLVAFACARPAENPPAATQSSASSEALAVYEGGSLSAADLDRAVLSLPATERLELRAGSIEPFRELLRSLVVERVLLAEARKQGLDQSPAFVAQMGGLRRQAVAKSYIDKILPAIAEPSEEELKKAFEERRSQLDQPEKRSVFHIFRRRTSEVPVEELVAALEKVRHRVLGGESFALLAAELSDSESRHQQGFIGDISRGQLPPQLEKVIFALEEEVPSEPILSKDGVHLFFIEAIAPARVTSFAEARSLMRSQLMAEKRSAAVLELLGQFAEPPGSFVPKAGELEALLRSGDREALVLRYGEFEIRLLAFLEMVARERQELTPSQNLKLAAQLPEHIFTALLQREKAYFAARAAGEELAPAAEAELETAERERLLERYRLKLLGQLLDEEYGDRLKTFFAENQRRFASPLQLRIRLLTIPGGPRASAQMAELESLRGEIEAGHQEMSALEAHFGGKLSELDWRTVDQLRMHDAKTTQFVGHLQKGQVSPPYTTARGQLEILQVLDRREPEDLPFEKVIRAVRSAYLAEKGSEVYARLIEKKLAEAGFVVDEKRLAAAVEALTSVKS